MPASIVLAARPEVYEVTFLIWNKPAVTMPSVRCVDKRYVVSD